MSTRAKGAALSTAMRTALDAVRDPVLDPVLARRQPPERFLSEQGCRALLERIMRLRRGGGEVGLYIRSEWKGNLRWARNEIITAGDTTTHEVRITRSIGGAMGAASTNGIDDASIADCLAQAERLLQLRMPNDDVLPPRRAEQYSRPVLWSEATAAVDAAARGALQRALVEPALAAQLLAAGYLEISAVGHGVANSAGLFAYVPQTRAEYSVTMRNAKGNGAGWTGVENLDWRNIDASALSAIALDKCKRSADPVAIEPGRYTVILEPQAVADLMLPLIQSLRRLPAEMGMGPWADRPDDVRVPDVVVGAAAIDESTVGTGNQGGRSKIGQQVLDPRVSISADPMDPDAPFVPFASDSTPMRAVTWIDQGVLKALSYPRGYALAQLNQQDPLNNSEAFRMAGGPTSIEDMIASTERGLLVTRLVNIRQLDFTTLLQTGTTSDGLWLIERGKITGPVKNFRFRESPLFAFNNLEALGPPTRVLMEQPTIVPPAKIRDFSMTSTADAV